MWRWLAQVEQSGSPARSQFTLEAAVRERLVFWRGNVTAVHRELVDAEVAGGPPAPSLRTLQRDLVSWAALAAVGVAPVVFLVAAATALWARSAERRRAGRAVLRLLGLAGRPLTVTRWARSPLCATAGFAPASRATMSRPWNRLMNSSTATIAEGRER